MRWSLQQEIHDKQKMIEVEYVVFLSFKIVFSFIIAEQLLGIFYLNKVYLLFLAYMLLEYFFNLRTFPKWNTLQVSLRLQN